MNQRKRKHLVQQRRHGIPAAVRIAQANRAARPTLLKARFVQLANTTDREPLSDVDVGKFLLDRLTSDPTVTDAVLAEQIGRSLSYVRKAVDSARRAK